MPSKEIFENEKQRLISKKQLPPPSPPEYFTVREIDGMNIDEETKKWLKEHRTLKSVHRVFTSEQVINSKEIPDQAKSWLLLQLPTIGERIWEWILFLSAIIVSTCLAIQSWQKFIVAFNTASLTSFDFFNFMASLVCAAAAVKTSFTKVLRQSKCCAATERDE